MVGGAGLVRDEAGQIILIRRSDDGEWCPPAGAMELGERIDRAVEREVSEVRFFPPDRLPSLPAHHLILIRDGLAGREDAFFR